MSVAIIDYKVCNLGSVKRAFQECGADAFISSDPKDIDAATHIVLPGVGAFSNAMKNLEDMGFVEYIKRAVLDDKIPLLGICLGMQLLADKGFEIKETPGLGLIKGEIIKLSPKKKSERVPHVGWNELDIKSGIPIFQSIANKTDFYFVHSFHFIPKDESNIISTTPYCDKIVSGIAKDNIFGVQFHPEKSSTAGFKLIKNFLNY